MLVVELHIEPSSSPSNMHKPANDRCWDCDAQTAITFATDNYLDTKRSVDGQYGLGNSARHDQSLQSFVSDK